LNEKALPVSDSLYGFPQHFCFFITEYTKQQFKCIIIIQYKQYSITQVSINYSILLILLHLMTEGQGALTQLTGTTEHCSFDLHPPL
jgi:hypothetical protein